MERALASLVLLALAFAAPWPFVLAAAALAMFYFPHFIEALVILALSDILFGVSEGFVPPAYAFLAGAALYILIAFLKSRMRAISY